MKYYVIYNPKSGNGIGDVKKDELKDILKGGEIEFINTIEMVDKKSFFESISPDDVVVLCGGDGTINRFANDVDGLDIPNELMYYPAGSGNDFYNDIKDKPLKGLLELNPYLENLPYVEVNGMKRCFLNGIGYGIDGYACEEGDRQRELTKKKVNYTMIAFLGLLYKFKPVNAKVTVDGVTREYHRVWLAPAMNGRFFGGGMMMAPEQDRLNKEGLITSAVVNNATNIKVLSVFPKIFKGNHVTHTEIVDIRQCHCVTVEFDRPVALQIDGETILNVLKYKAYSHDYVE